MDRQSADNLPGADLVRRGIDDLNHAHLSIEALLVAIGSPRLRHLGFNLPATDSLPQRPEHQLYALLENDDERDAYSRYNALIRRLVSFERAMEFEQARATRLRS
jgi:hypothetical protein